MRDIHWLQEPIRNNELSFERNPTTEINRTIEICDSSKTETYKISIIPVELFFEYNQLIKQRFEIFIRTCEYTVDE